MQYSNEHFSLSYPASWEVVGEELPVQANSVMSLIIMQKQMNDYDFRPNINIICSGKKINQPTTEIYKRNLQRLKSNIPQMRIISLTDVSVGGCNGTRGEVEYVREGYKLRMLQYFVKKPDNTYLVITTTLDANYVSAQQKISDAIINSIKIRK